MLKTKLKIEYKITLITLVFLTSFTLITKVIALKINSEYQKIISNKELISLIKTNDIRSIDTMTKSLGYDYQYINEGKIIKQSITDLPKPNIINITIKPTQNVIETTPEAYIKQLLPYVMKSGKNIYLTALVATGLDSDDYYLIYSRLL